ncbi:MAG: phosphate ABC transporter permease PstA [Planctomycetia bacterium]|nr:phosphate ABC transporter permease PstA [Planctomycetia bacterium]
MSVSGNLREPALAKRHRIGQLFEWLCCGSTWFGMVVLALLLLSIGWKAMAWPTPDADAVDRAAATKTDAKVAASLSPRPLSARFLTSYDSRIPQKAGIKAALWGSLWLLVFVAITTVPVGVGAAVYLEEYSNEGRWKRIIQVNLSNLAGVPSIVYGILGLTVFVRMFGLFGHDGKVLDLNLGFAMLSLPLPFERSVISGALTLSLLVLPTVIVSAQEALRAVPSSIRNASYALGATQWQTIRHQVLPAAMPGIMTGVILSLSRAMGETAPLIMIGALTYLAKCPGKIDGVAAVWEHPTRLLEAPFDVFTSLPIQIFNWVSRAQPEYDHLAAAGIMVLLVVLMVMNTAAILIRNRFQRRTQW